MPTYAIGDIQGCREQFESLLDKIQFDPASDRLWIAGDMVNRGPDSLGTLRLLYSLRDQISVVLGNHDLHMLAAAHYSGYRGSKDTFQDVIEAHDAEQLLNWVRKQPLLQEADDFVMCHAGIHPSWSLPLARALAEEAQRAYQADDPGDYYQGMYGNLPEFWDDELHGSERLRFITNVFTRMRFCDQAGALKMEYKATIEGAPDNLSPWFLQDLSDWQGKTLLIGHWAALQSVQPLPNLICLDTGCVWGRQLSALCLETGDWHQVSGLRN